MAAQVDTWPDADLIDAARGGNADAFTALYDRYVQRVYRLISSRLGRNADAEDLTQQTFVNAWHALGRYRQTEVPFVAWLLKIAYNASISHLRATRFHVELDEALDRAGAGDVSDGVIAEEGRLAVIQALNRLQGDQGQAVWMRYMEDLSYEEIAQQLGKSVETVRVIMHRGLRKLRSHLQP